MDNNTNTKNKINNKRTKELEQDDEDQDSNDGKLAKLQTVAIADASSFRVPENEHRLQTPWTLYWLNKSQLEQNSSQESYLSKLNKLGTFNSIESFWRHYCHLKRPSRLEHGYNVAVFRANLVPAWEVFYPSYIFIKKFLYFSVFEYILSHFQLEDVG